MTSVRQWRKGTLARAILLSLLVISIAPLVFISVLFINESSTALNQQLNDHLQDLAQARANDINNRLEEVKRQTEIAAQQAAFILQQPVADTLATRRINRYKPDQRNIVGLDAYYAEQGGEAKLGHNLSNVFWNRPMTSQAVQEIVQTENLNAIFESIKAVNSDTQWIYLTTADGMMRLYPWASNDNYPQDWDPRQVIFYTVAAPAGNPTLQPQWTPPYVDFAGAGWMVTLSAPVLDAKSNFLGVMSHDITIKQLKDIALNTTVLNGTGYGFLIDQNGGVIAHPKYEAQLASKGTEGNISLLTEGSADFQALVQRMVNGEAGLGTFEDPTAGEQILVYQPIPAIGWRLGVVVPHATVLAPVTEMRNRALVVTALLIGLATALAFLLTRQIHRPLLKLMEGVRQMSEHGQADQIEVRSFIELDTLAQSFNEMAASVFERHTSLQAKVNELTIKIDAHRQKEQVDSIVESDYFKHLEITAERLRNQLKGVAPIVLGPMIAGGTEQSAELPPDDPARPSGL
ncbi:MAG TPA: cache domain-containing protein [Anaerolineae bacterium]|nr:cache domain-containing protein [Anaerolineae bacterium]